MSINFSKYPWAAYSGNIVSKPFQRVNQSGIYVAASINWVSYSSGGQSVGTQVPAFAVQINFSNNANIPQPFSIVSVYIDNSGSLVPIYVYFPDTGYTVECPPNAFGWFPGFTNGTIAWVAGNQFVTGFLPLTTVGFTNVFVSPYVAAAQPQAIQQKLASPNIAIGGGSSLSNPQVIATGSCYNVGAVGIAGGGGFGAAGTYSVNAYGQITAWNLSNSGESYTGIPTVTPSGGQFSLPAFNLGNNYNPGSPGVNNFTYQGTIWYFNGPRIIHTGAAAWASGGSYNIGSYTNYGGQIYYCYATGAFFNLSPPPSLPEFWQYIGSALPNASYNWVNSGVAYQTIAQLAVSLGTYSSPANIASTGYGTPALGDQVSANIATVTAGTFLELFGTPNAQGFVYVTSIDIRVLAVAACNFQLYYASPADDIVMPFQITAGHSVGDCLCNLSNINMKLDATQSIVLNGSNVSGEPMISVYFGYTYALT